ncbi:MAG: antibiotic biosynthesis monooxygenase [Proteobacteria bacterium]|nr:antibiotic biosynthesis monooxygenase [Pseudomonadota bacterium]
MIVVVFRTRRAPAGFGAEYQDWLTRMSEIAVTMPGYISHKGYVADDGERLTFVEWESMETLRGWMRHPQHAAAKKIGREKFYEFYTVQICDVTRQSQFEASPTAT